MKWRAVFLLNNSFFKIEVENHDESANFVRKDCETLADKFGLQFMYLEEIEDDQ